jgi:hypothetical protein
MGAQTTPVRAADTIKIGFSVSETGPGLDHAIDNTGLENLVFIVVNVPADELPRVDTRV